MPRAGQLADDALDIQHRERIDARERFIEQDEARFGSQRAGDLDAAPLAAGQRHARVLRTCADAQLLQQFLQPLLARRAVQIGAQSPGSP